MKGIQLWICFKPLTNHNCLANIEPSAKKISQNQ